MPKQPEQTDDEIAWTAATQMSDLARKNHDETYERLMKTLNTLRRANTHPNRRFVTVWEDVIALFETLERQRAEDRLASANLVILMRTLELPYVVDRENRGMERGYFSAMVDAYQIVSHVSHEIHELYQEGHRHLMSLLDQKETRLREGEHVDPVVEKQINKCQTEQDNRNVATNVLAGVLDSIQKKVNEAKAKLDNETVRD